MWYSAVGGIVTVTLSLLAMPCAITAQPRGKIPRVGVLEPTSQAHPAPCLFAFQQGLHDLGYVEGQTILLDYRYAEEHVDRLPALAAELVQLAPDVLWLHWDPAAWAAKRATATIPIVFSMGEDPVLVVRDSQGTIHAFLWTQAGGVQDLGSPQGGTSGALAINAAGEVAGYSYPAGGRNDTHAFYWSAATGAIDLTTDENTQSFPSAINFGSHQSSSSLMVLSARLIVGRDIT